MNRYLIIILSLVVFMSGCRKEEVDPPVEEYAEISFNFTPGNDLKLYGDYGCFEGEGDYAYIVISGTEYFLDVFYLNGIPYTKSIKFDSRGNFLLEEFMLLYDNNTPDNLADDTVIMAAPHAGSVFASFVTNPLHYPFSINEFDKIEIPIEVLCYYAADYDKFGFEHFSYDDFLLREEYFYGYLCVHTLSDYEGSLYEDQAGGLLQNMPAIFMIEVYRNGELQDTVFTNESWLGEGQPLKVIYEDRNFINETFEFKLYVFVDSGDKCEYRYFHTWYKSDDESWEHGGNGVMDFIIGTCATDVDVRLPNHMDLPTDCDAEIVDSEPGASTNAYVDLELSDVATKYDISNGIWPAWGLDTAVAISTGTTGMDVFSSLYTGLMPECIQDYNWKAANWLLNNLDLYPGYEWWELQQALWKIGVDHNGTVIGGVPAATVLSDQMAADALSNAPSWQGPFMGDMAAAIFLPEGTSPDEEFPQFFIMFTIVDP